MSQREYLQKIFRLACRQTLETFGSTIRTVVLGAATLGLGVLFHRYWRGWPNAKEEFIIFTFTSLAPLLVAVVAVFIWKFFWYTPYTLHAQLSEKLAKFDITILQVRGGGDNLLRTYSTSDSTNVLIRDLVLVNNSERDEVVSLQLWWPLNNNDGVLFSPQPDPPQNIAYGPLLTRVENISAKRALTGSLFFRIPRRNVPPNSAPFFIIMVKSQLTGIERAFNSLNFSEVTKPYPRTLEELNQQLASAKQRVLR